VKKQTKGIFFTVLFGGGLLFWATAATVLPSVPEDPASQVTITGTPMDNYPDAQRAQFCGSEDFASFATMSSFLVAALPKSSVGSRPRSGPRQSR